MKIPRIYQSQPLTLNERIYLDEDAMRHVSTVLRLSTASKIILFNGDGSEYLAEITLSKRKKLEVLIIEKTEKSIESPLSIHLGQVISKGPHMDFTVQKAVELGVHTLTPLYSTRSDVHLKGEREERKEHHWQKIIIHACEQSGRNVLPKLEKPIPLLQWVKERSENTKIALNPYSNHSLKSVECHDTIALLIGPEGGLSQEEIHYLTKNGFSSIKLGPRTLRTETAGIAALAMLQFLKGDL